MSSNNFGLCVIITAPILPYKEVAEVCVKCGVKYLQLREKQLTDREVLQAAAEIKSITDGTDTAFVMNDRADLALLAGADMLHLGQSDISLSDARRIVGDKMPIGLSTHSLEQAQAALSQNPHYIGFGPIYATPTKAIADPAVGTELLSKVLSLSKVPVIAIGGLFPENIDSVLKEGAQNICLVRHLMESDSCQVLERRINNLISLL